MKDKIIFWGRNDKDQKILVIVRLRAADKKVDLWTMPHEKLEEEIVEKWFQNWDTIDVENLPDYANHIEREVSSSDLLPTDIRADQTEIIIRAEKEWYFKVLSLQLYQTLKADIDALEEQVTQLTTYDKGLWDTAKNYWDKILQHIQEQNISRGHASELRNSINHIFNKLKALLNTENSAFEQEAKANFDSVDSRLKDFWERIETNKNVQKVFGELKDLQEEIKKLKLTPPNRREIWKKIDDTFTFLKSKQKNAFQSRTEVRINGLKKAIADMEKFVAQDRDSIAFQRERMGKSGAGQLEMQLREAKAQMISARLQSKELKLKDMYATLQSLEDSVSKLHHDREKAAALIASVDSSDAAQPSESWQELKQKGKDVLQSLGSNLGSGVKAAKEKSAEALEKLDKTTQPLQDKGAELLEQLDKTTQPLQDKGAELLEQLGDKLEPVTNTLKGLFNSAKDFVSDAVENVKEKVQGADTVVENAETDIEDKVKNTAAVANEIKAEELKDAAEENIAEAKDAIAEKSESVTDTVKGWFSKAGDQAEELKDAAEENIAEAKDAIAKKSESVTDTVKGWFSKAGDQAEELKDEADKKIDDIEGKV